MVFLELLILTIAKQRPMTRFWVIENVKCFRFKKWLFCSLFIFATTKRCRLTFFKASKTWTFRSWKSGIFRIIVCIYPQTVSYDTFLWVRKHEISGFEKPIILHFLHLATTEQCHMTLFWTVLNLKLLNLKKLYFRDRWYWYHRIMSYDISFRSSKVQGF